MMESAVDLPLQREASPESWPCWARIGFRFAFVFWLLFFVADGGLDLVLWVWPWFSRHVNSAASWPTDKLSIWVGRHVFHLSGDAALPHVTGSGDTALAWIGCLVALVVALVVCAVWSAVSEIRARRTEYRTLYAWLRLGLRFLLASTLLAYGFSKVFDLQFSPPMSYRLNETYGNSSPMGLLWTFMGASVPYTVFAGLAEVVPGVLLFFRRTSTVGAMLSSAVMLNVAMLNFCYDVPVKLYSTELLLLSLFLLLPDFAPMWRFFVLRREAALTGVWVRRSERRPLRVAGHCLQTLVVAYLLYSNVTSSYTQRKERLASRAPKTDTLAGAWTVDSSTGWPADEQWKNVSFDAMPNQNKEYAGVTQANGKLAYYFFVPTGAAHDMRFLGVQGSALHWERDGAEYVNLKGTWAGNPATLRMHQQPAAPLLSRGFHWVQEYPYNR
jgi:uncharacterized membrane protein YphA (DoxX/SURF4 family)